MSVSYSCQLVAGVSIKRSALVQRTRERGCSHPETANKFCGQCGKPTWENHEGEVELLFRDRGIEDFHPNTEDFETDSDDLDVIVGLRVSVATNGLVEPIDMDGAEERVKAAFEQLGLQPTGRFGLHLVRRVSY